jgi:DNA-binding NtrC family response regulator
MRTIRTLIVDDEVTSREGMRQLLAADPEVVVVGECSNGREAVAAIRDTAPDLVFLDVRMDDLSAARGPKGCTTPYSPLPFRGPRMESGPRLIVGQTRSAAIARTPMAT